MLEFLKKQFSEYKENRKMVIPGYNDFIREISEKIDSGGQLKINPHNSNQILKWNINKNKKGKLVFNHIGLKGKFLDFKNQILSLCRKHGILAIILRVKTNQFYKNKEITELWGYRLFLIENLIVLERIPVDNLYIDCTVDSKTGEQIQPEANTVYCGFDGKIMGWEKI